MADRVTVKDPSLLVIAVLALDGHLSEMQRLGSKFVEMELKTDFDFEQARQLIGKFSESAQKMAGEVTNLSGRLNDARAQAESLAAAVAEKAQVLSSRKTDEEKLLDEYRQLGEEVRALTMAATKWKPPEDSTLSDEQRAALSGHLAQFEAQLNPLIEKVQSLRKEAQSLKMKVLAQNTESLAQTLQSIRSKLGSLH